EYTVRYENTGNTVATASSVTVTFPAGAVLAGSSVVPTATTPTGATFAVGDLLPGDGGEITLTLSTPACGLGAGDGEVSVVAAITTPDAESSVTDNEAAATTYVTGGG